MTTSEQFCEAEAVFRRHVFNRLDNAKYGIHRSESEYCDFCSSLVTLCYYFSLGSIQLAEVVICDVCYLEIKSLHKSNLLLWTPRKQNDDDWEKRNEYMIGVKGASTANLSNTKPKMILVTGLDSLCSQFQQIQDEKKFQVIDDSADGNSFVHQLCGHYSMDKDLSEQEKQTLNFVRYNMVCSKQVDEDSGEIVTLFHESQN